ncbi:MULTISPECIES: sn-glycerol-3-phosphate ABC transporter permease UgpE [Nitratireductor]|uniref:sn-glycerol-3-phosphate ABC transporter permease UgpE n=1 Tax=Nitratireductor TaxID=245876 RepID=UPI000D0D929C|nr:MULTISPECIES: sn-glycerol-3-phosphate ABC transporter permease UgpE [Nitratireductor]PSM16258.1 sn-glycerol-3-phosphate ABC transporter permease UgpE [Nitratireductor sp. StC3]
MSDAVSTARPLAPASHRPAFKWGPVFDHAILIAGAAFMLVPVFLAFMTSTHDAVTIHTGGVQALPGTSLVDNYATVMFDGLGFSGAVNGTTMMLNSMILGLGFAVGKIVLSMMAAYAIVYFRFPLAEFAFWAIFVTLLLPLEVRILPSYEIVQSMGLINTYTGLIVPLVASATGTFFFRQFFKSVPDELIEAARIDGAGPLKFFRDILLPLSRTMIAAIFIIMFVYGWNQYLWPTLITTNEDYFTLVRGIKQIIQVWVGSQIPEYGQAMALAVLAMLPPVIVVVVFQSWFIKGLTESDK